MGKRRSRTVDIDTNDYFSKVKEIVPANKAWARFEQFLQSRRKSDSTILTYRHNMSRFIRWISENEDAIESNAYDIATVEIADIEEYILHLTNDKQLQGNTVNSFIKSARAFWNFVSKTYTGIENICEEIQRVEVDAEMQWTPSTLELDVFYSGLNLERFVDCRTYTCCKIAQLAGLRLGEVANLTVNDITNKTIIVRKSKSRRFREIPISDTLQPILDMWLSVRGDVQTEALFINEFDQKVSQRTLSHHVKQLAEQTGVPITMHSLRRYFCTQMISSNKVDLITISRLMGHSGPNLLMKYGQTTDKQKRVAVNIVNMKKQRRE